MINVTEKEGQQIPDTRKRSKVVMTRNMNEGKECGRDRDGGGGVRGGGGGGRGETRFPDDQPLPSSSSDSFPPT